MDNMTEVVLTVLFLFGVNLTAPLALLSTEVFAQGDLQGYCVLTPRPMVQLNPEFVYRGATTTHPLHFPEHYGASAYDSPRFLDAAHSRVGLRRTIQSLADQQVPFLLPEGLVTTNPEFRTPSFDLGFLNKSQFDMGSFWTLAQRWAMEDPDYWYGIKELYDLGYRPVVRHHLLGLSKDTLVMQRPGALTPGIGQLPTFIDGTLVGPSPMASGAVHCVNDSLMLSSIPPSLFCELPTYDRYLRHLAMPDLDEKTITFFKDSGLWALAYGDESLLSASGSISDSFPDGVRYQAGANELHFDPQGKSVGTGTVAQSTGPDVVIISRHSSVPGQLQVERLPLEHRLKAATPEVRLRYQRVCSTLRRQHLRSSVGGGLRLGAAGGGRLLRGAGSGLVVQYGVSEGLKASAGLSDDKANMVIMPLSEAAGMVAVDLALPALTSTATTSAATTATTGAATTTGLGASVASGAIGGLAVVTEATRRSADHHHLKLLYDQNSMEMGTQMTIYLMRRNARLRDIGEISQEELVRRNNALARSARREGERTAEEAQWVYRRYRNIVTACFGTIGDSWDCWNGWDYWTGSK